MQIQQEYILQNVDSFELNHVFDCGQCFRRNQQPDWSYTWIFWNNILNIQKKSDSVIFLWIVDWDIQTIVNQYFDLDRDYDKIKTQLSKVDNYMKESIQYW
jgi:N-glycosylase/DNA lyase